MRELETLCDTAWAAFEATERRAPDFTEEYQRLRLAREEKELQRRQKWREDMHYWANVELVTRLPNCP